MNIFGKKEFDLVSIGDTVVDDFIKIKNSDIENEGDGRQEICFNFGDKIPYEDNYLIPAVGNSANASVAAARLGLKTALVSNLGNDQDGALCLDSLKKDRVTTDFVTVHKNLKTNYHYVLWFGDNRTILIKHEKYPYSLPDIGTPKWIYLSSLGENSRPFHNDLSDYLEKNPNINLAFQPGTYQMKFDPSELKRIYNRTNLFFCNRMEARRILRTENDDINFLAKGLKDLGPKQIFITDGKNGVYFCENNKLMHLPIVPDCKPPVESTGAGDAFSSTVVSAIYLGLDLETSVKWGLVNSMSVVQQIGAQAGLLSRKQIEDILQNTSKNFCSTLITENLT
jgi:sugar/nucleoside kinase (ribokinase family)